MLSPHREIYALLMPQFEKTPAPDQAAIEGTGFWLGKSPSLFAQILEKAAAKVQKYIFESWENELLRDGGRTSASNESSVVLYGDFGPKRRVLLTGDIGVWGWSMAAHYADANGLQLQDFMFVQIPHHGSRRNVGPTVLNRVIGPILARNSATRFSAFVSAPKKDESHPRKMVLNAFSRRGGRVLATQGAKRVFPDGFPARDGDEPVSAMPFASKVEDYE